MSGRKSDRYVFLRGYIPTQALVGSDIIPAYFGGVSHSVIDGVNGWIRGTRVETALGPGAAGSSGASIPVLMNVANGYGGVTGGGSIVQYYTQYLYAGSGTAYVNGSSIGAAGSSIMEVPVGGGAAVPVGIAAPTIAPVIADSGQPGKNNGSYSVLYTWIRSATGEESNRSPVSNAVAVQNDGIMFSQAISSPGNGVDKIGVYCSFANFSTLGPWFHLVDLSLPVTSGTIIGLGGTAGWYNGDLGVIAPLDYNPPPACSFVFSLNDIVVAAGCYPAGGNGLSPSVPGKFGAFPPEFVVFLPGGGNITACKATSSEGMALVSTANSLYLVSATYSTTTPIDIKQVWPTVGFASGNSFCMVENELYGFSGQRGAVRTQGFGAPDTSWAAPVAERFVGLGFTVGNTVVVYDPSTDCILYCSGTNALPYDRKYNHWHTPQSINPITSGVTSQGVGLLESSGALQALETGTGTSGFVTTAFRDAELPGVMKSYVRVRAIGNNSFTFDLLADPGNLGSSALTLGPLNTDPKSAWQKINLRNVSDLAIKTSWTNLARASIAEVDVVCVPHPVSVG
jgi:hypothetical protein